MLKEGLAPITEATANLLGKTGIPEPLHENGVDVQEHPILAQYDKVGKFDLKRLEVKTLECGLETLDKYKTFTEDQPKLITICAHTSHGKSALLMQLAAHISNTRPVFVHSFEMTTEEIETRLLSAVANIPTSMIIEGSAHFAKVQKAREDFAQRQLYISNIQNRSLGFVQSQLFELAKVLGRPGLVVIDYAQQVKPGGTGNQQRVNEITDISAGFLQLAQQLKCNVVIGAQLNNEILKRAYGSKDEDGNMEYIPGIADIREGSSFAHDSSCILSVVRPYVFDRNKDKEKSHFYCLKNRGGELWDQEMLWDGSRCQFKEMGVMGL